MRVARLVVALCMGVTVTACGASGNPDAPPALDAIKEADLSRDLHFLAGDTLRGREAGTLDELRASVWLADRMREAGLEPAGDDGTYYQFWSIRRLRQSDDSRIMVGDTPIEMGTEAVVLSPTDAIVDAPLLFVPAGTTPSAASVRGRAVATVMEPPTDTSISPRRYATRAVRELSTKFIDMGAVAVIVVSDSIAEGSFNSSAASMERGRYGIDTAGVTAYWPDREGGPRRPAVQPPVIWARASALERVRVAGQRLRTRLVTENFLYPSVNIVGRIPGTDPALRDEYVLYSGHQDHDGVRFPIDGDSIWNGADDNGSVSVAMLAIARAMAEKPARRSILFVWHGAEERGLLGSRYFVMNPTVPKTSIVAVLNGDMIGRNNPDTASILGLMPPHRNSADLVRMALDANENVTRFAIDSTWDMQAHREGWYFRSDHLPYARAGYPAIFFSTNLHGDYHTPRDEPENIDYQKLTRMTQWMYATGWMVANADARPAIDSGFKLER